MNNDNLCDLDHREEVILVLLDLSAAFNTIDHLILFSHLEHRFSIRGIALDWIKSYFSDRLQRIFIGDQYFKPSTLTDGVSQGSCFGPILFTLNCSPLEEIIRKYYLDFMIYADNSQLYLTCNNTCASKTIINSCLDEIRTWMAANPLILNDAKTEVQHFKFRSCDFIVTLYIGEDNVQPIENVRNLGSYFDCTASCTVQVANICR